MADLAWISKACFLLFNILKPNLIGELQAKSLVSPSHI